jgi:hypothetical protein
MGHMTSSDYEPTMSQYIETLKDSSISAQGLEVIVDDMIFNNTSHPSRPTRHLTGVLRKLIEHPNMTTPIFRKMFTELPKTAIFYLVIVGEIRPDIEQEFFELSIEGHWKAKRDMAGFFYTKSLVDVYAPLISRFISWYDSKNILDIKLADMPRDMIPDMLGFNTKD